MEEIVKYQPSNGTEGEFFTEQFCERCRNEKFMHTGNPTDLKCDIFSRTMLYHVNDNEYPIEWRYDKNDDPTCIAFIRHDWRDDDGNLIEPEPIHFDPDQLDLFEQL